MKKEQDTNYNIETELATMIKIAGNLTLVQLSTYMLMNKISKYKFCKETSINNIKIYLPPYIEKCDKRDISEFNLKYRKAIRNFLKILKWKLSHVSPNLFLKNLKDLKIETKNNYIRRTNKNIIGEYSVLDNIITLIKGDKTKSIYHELLHSASSTFYANKIYSGFKQVVIKNKKTYSIGTGLNEGYTALLEKRYFNTYGKKQSYVLEKKLAGILELIIGSKCMEKLYFNADLHTLTKIMNKYKEETEILNFYKKLDYLSKNNDSVLYINKDRKQCLDCLEYCGKFLLELYMENTINCIEKMQKNEVTFDMLGGLYRRFATLLNDNVTILCKDYKILDTKKSNEIINEFIENQKVKTLSFKAL